MFTWQYIYLCCINIALLSISLLGYYMLGLFKPFLTPDTFPWDIFSCFKVPSWINICTVQNVFTVQCKYYDYMIQLRGALIDWTLDGVSRSYLRWVYQQELQGPWLVSSCSLCLWYLHALCNCDCSIYWYFNFSVYMKYGRINMFLFLFIFVTKMSFCFHTIEIKSCKKNLHKDVPHNPTFQSRTEHSPPVVKTKASDSLKT